MCCTVVGVLVKARISYAVCNNLSINSLTSLATTLNPPGGDTGSRALPYNAAVADNQLTLEELLPLIASLRRR